MLSETLRYNCLENLTCAFWISRRTLQYKRLLTFFPPPAQSWMSRTPTRRRRSCRRRWSSERTARRRTETARRTRTPRSWRLWPVSGSSALLLVFSCLPQSWCISVQGPFQSVLCLFDLQVRRSLPGRIIFGTVSQETAYFIRAYGYFYRNEGGHTSGFKRLPPCGDITKCTRWPDTQLMEKKNGGVGCWRKSSFRS